MSKKNAKDEFVKLFQSRMGGQHPNDFKENPKELANIMNRNPELRDLFREAVAECTPTVDEEAASGLSNLFPDGM